MGQTQIHRFRLMAMYLLCILGKDESAPTFVRALLYRFAFHNFSCIYVSSFLSQVLFIIVDKWFVNLFKRAPRKIGTANWVTLGK